MTQTPPTQTPAPQKPRRGKFRWRNLNWFVVGPIGSLHIVALFVFWPRLFTWSGLIIFAVLFWLTAGIGITLCYHRLLTHRSFKTPKWFEYVITICGCLAWQGGPVDWVGVHRIHHKHSDKDRDPHSPKHGFSWSHVFWLLHRRTEDARGEDAAKDLLRDPGTRWIDRLCTLPQIILAVALFFIGWAWDSPWLGFSWIVWGVALRTVVVYHGTWFVNSAAHTWGYQNYKDTGEHSTNLWWVSLLSFGEGWHNNHHALPRSAAHGLRWFELDPTWWTIRVLSWVGLAKDIQRPKPDQLPKRRKTMTA